MRERPILLNSEMVRAILSGQKTQTRRIMKVQPESDQFGLLRITDSTKRSDIGKYHWAESNACGTHVRSMLFSCPFGAVGDRIWVRETFASGLSTKSTLAYRATHKREDLEDGFYDTIKWTPSIHMPRWASRITLEITDVRVERLQDITDVESMREGIQNLTTCSHGDFGIPGAVTAQNPRRAFQLLWESIYGKGSWQANPWVWVIEFKRVEASND